MAASLSRSAESVKCPRSILRNPIQSQRPASVHHLSPPSDTRPRSVTGLETDSDTSHREVRLRHSVADLRTLAEPERRQTEEGDSGVGEDPWIQYKSLIQIKKQIILQQHLNWVNSILSRRGYQPITDLCHIIQDGVTLINLVQILTNEQVAAVWKKPSDQRQRIENIQNCLHHLELHNVDTQGLRGVDLIQGNLKSTLILMNNLKKRYENYQAYPPRSSTGLVRDGTQSQTRPSQLCATYQPPSNKPPTQLPGSTQSPSRSMQLTVAGSPSVTANTKTTSPNRNASPSYTAYSPGHRPHAQTPNADRQQLPINLIPGVIMDNIPPSRPPLPQGVLTSSGHVTKFSQFEGSDPLMTPKSVYYPQTSETLSDRQAVHSRWPDYRQVIVDGYGSQVTDGYRQNVAGDHKPTVTECPGLPISDSYRTLGPVISAQSVSQSTNPCHVYRGRSTSVTPSHVAHAWSTIPTHTELFNVQQTGQCNTQIQASGNNQKSNEQARCPPPKLHGHLNAGYEHDAGELIVPPKPSHTRETPLVPSSISYVPSHPLDRPTSFPRQSAQPPIATCHMSPASRTHEQQAPPMYNPPPQYGRAYIQGYPSTDRNNRTDQDLTAQNGHMSASASQPNVASNTNKHYNQRYQDVKTTHDTNKTSALPHTNATGQQYSQSNPSSVATAMVNKHRAIPANDRASPQGQSSTPASQSPNHDKTLTLKCSQSNHLSVDHVASVARYNCQTPTNAYQTDFVKPPCASNSTKTDNVFTEGQIPPSSVYPTSGAELDRVLLMEPSDRRHWTKQPAERHGPSPHKNTKCSISGYNKALQDDVEAVYSMVRKQRQERIEASNSSKKKDAGKIACSGKQEPGGTKIKTVPSGSAGHRVPPSDADDWNSDESSMTPPLPPLSPSNSPTPPGSPTKTSPHTNKGLDVMAKPLTSHRKGQRSGSSARLYETGWRRSGPGRAAYRTYARTRIPVTRNLSEADSIDHYSTSNLSDGDEWEDVITTTEVHKIHQQMDALEMMYTEILKMLGVDKEYIPGSRRSISSLSSLSRSGKQRTRTRTSSHRSAREIRSMNKRLNRLEAHVVTLARSVANLSSEMHSQNSLREELDELKQDLRQLRKERHHHHTTDGTTVPGTGLMAGLLSAGHADSRRLTEFEKFRGWIPSITNPKRVKKLAKFFGEDRLLQYFLEKLGYQKYIKNFRAEEITILELPYMSEERLEKLGIPMGPRQRILQEAQMCFRQENFNIYIV